MVAWRSSSVRTSWKVTNGLSGRGLFGLLRPMSGVLVPCLVSSLSVDDDDGHGTECPVALSLSDSHCFSFVLSDSHCVAR